MSSNLDKYKKDLEYLLKLGHKMLIDLELQGRENKGEKLKEPEHEPGSIFFSTYQDWYSEAHAVVKQLLSDRLDEFERLYKGDTKRKQLNGDTYTIQDWLNGVRAKVNGYTGNKYYDDFSITTMKFQTQHSILRSAKLRFESSLFDINQLLQADLFDSEIDSARELIKKGFQRGAGAIAGVVLEKHLEQICINHNVTINKKDPAINDLNDLLKNASVIDLPNWRYIQRLGDLRNLRDHNKKRAPAKEEVAELVDGVEKIIKTIF